MKSPFITRKHAQRLTKAAVDECEVRNARLRSEFASLAQKSREELRQDFEQRIKPIMQRMVEVSGRPVSGIGDFVLHFNLDRHMLEQAAMSNDKIIWRHIAELIGHHIERELAQMNFAGLHKMADDYERRYRRQRYELPSSILSSLP